MRPGPPRVNPCAAQHHPHVFDDFSREFIKVARFFERRGRSSAQDGHAVSAREDYFAASIAFAAAQWPICSDVALNRALEQKNADCYLEFACRANHHVETVEIPYADRTIRG